VTRIDVGDEADGADGLLALVIAVVEILIETMEREAIRRMDEDDLTDDEVERIGVRLAELDAELDRLKDEMAVQEPVDNLRGELDGLVGNALSAVQADGVAAGTWPEAATPNQSSEATDEVRR
jgi:hypothetical protein